MIPLNRTIHRLMCCNKWEVELMGFFQGKGPDLKNMGAYCTCQVENGRYNIEVRAKQSNYLAFFCAHSLSELHTIRTILLKNGVEVGDLDKMFDRNQ